MSRTCCFSLVIIGGGTAALTALEEALYQGVDSVALIEQKQELGGECALNACVPTKTLLTAARYLKMLHEKAPQYGILADNIRLDFDILKAKKEAVIQDGNSEFVHDERVEIIQGLASFLSSKEVQVRDEIIQGDKIIIATGSIPFIPSIEGLDEAGYLLFPQVSHFETLPKSLIIIGGGAVGVEYAYMLQSFGCKITLIQQGEHLLTNEEPEISEAVEKLLSGMGVTLHLNCKLNRVSRTNANKQVHFTCDGKQLEYEAEDIFIAVGVRANIEKLNLDAADVVATEKGIQVDDELRTTCKTIWAIGDVVGPYRFTHTADYQAEIAVRNAISGNQDKVSYAPVPWAIFTDPPVAHVGLTEAQAKENYEQVIPVRVKSESVSRYRIESEQGSFLKLIVDGKTDCILGAHAFGSSADEYIQMLTLAICNQMTVQQVQDMIYIYPTKAQIIQKAAEQYVLEKEAINSYSADCVTKRIVLS